MQVTAESCPELTPKVSSEPTPCRSRRGFFQHFLLILAVMVGMTLLWFPGKADAAGEQGTRLRVRLTRPDGSQTDCFYRGEPARATVILRTDREQPIAGQWVYLRKHTARGKSDLGWVCTDGNGRAYVDFRSAIYSDAYWVYVEAYYDGNGRFAANYAEDSAWIAP